MATDLEFEAQVLGLSIYDVMVSGLDIDAMTPGSIAEIEDSIFELLDLHRNRLSFRRGMRAVEYAIQLGVQQFDQLIWADWPEPSSCDSPEDAERRMDLMYQQMTLAEYIGFLRRLFESHSDESVCCPYCGHSKEIKATGHPKTYCSDRCRKAASRERTKDRKPTRSSRKIK